MTTERDPSKQLVTAKILLAMFEAQLTEYDGMSDHDREHTEHGRDLTARLPSLRQGHTQWQERTRALEQHIAQATPHTPLTPPPQGPLVGTLDPPRPDP